MASTALWHLLLEFMYLLVSFAYLMGAWFLCGKKNRDGQMKRTRIKQMGNSAKTGRRKSNHTTQALIPLLAPQNTLRIKHIWRVLPTMAYTTAARYRNFSVLLDSQEFSLTVSPDFNHLSSSWNNNWRPPRQSGVSITELRCLMYTHRYPLCYFCNETVQRFFFYFARQRRKSCSCNTDSLGSSSMGYCRCLTSRLPHYQRHKKKKRSTC